MRVVTVALAIASGLFVLLGYAGELFQLQPLVDLQVLLVDWAIVIAGMAALVGIFHLAAVQVEKFRTRQKGGIYGMLLVLSLLATLVVGVIWGPTNLYMQLAVDAIIVPVEASLMAILAVTLIYASIRLLRRRVDVMSIIFLVIAVIFLAAMMPTPFPEQVAPIQDYVLQGMGLLSQGGARGLLIGIALGTLLTGLRVLFGVDRPYGGN
jgi:hypothetical protein